jgi:GTP-binding protein
VHEQSGVTRDRLMREVSWEEERFELIDTGGVCPSTGSDPGDWVEDDIRRQVEAALQDAAVSILVVDIEAGLVPMDEAVAGFLRGKGCQVVVAANKADHHGRDGDAAEFEKLGFPVFPVSALHNRGFGELLEKVTGVLPDVENPTLADPLKVAIVGKPNVGKSSFINRLLRADRVIVADRPGTTRDSIDVPFSVGKGDQARHYVLIDTAGIRRVGKIDNSVERFSRFRAEKSIAKADVVVLVMDAETGPTAQDKRIASMIQDNRKGCVMVINKWDLSESTQRQAMPAIAAQLPFMNYCPISFISAKTGYNIRRSVEIIDYVASQVALELPTGILNRVIGDAVNRVQAPASKGRRLKIFYATQVGVEPVRIRIFVNDPRRVVPAYREYLVKQLRRQFGLEGAAVELQFRARRKDTPSG